MPTMLKAALILGFAAIQTPMAVSSSYAADLQVHSRHHARHHGWARLVRDYDGTPIVLRRARHQVVASVFYSPPSLYDAYEALRAQPTRYLNGQPVRTHWKAWVVTAQVW